MRIDRLKKQYDIFVKWIAFPLHTDTPENGLTLEELFAGCNFDIEQMMKRLRSVASDLGLPFGQRRMTYNSRLAQELSKWAESRDCGDQFREAIFRAYFVEGINIAKPNELVRLAVSISLPEKEARVILDTRSFKEAVDDDWRLSRSLGITAVPTFRVNKARLVGAQPYEDLEEFLIREGGKKRNDTR